MCDVIVRFGTEGQKRRFLPDMASDEKRGGICRTESNAGTYLQNLSTTAKRKGNVYRIDGSKLWIVLLSSIQTASDVSDVGALDKGKKSNVQ